MGAKHRDLAVKRAAILWKHYNDNGKLLCADVFALTGKRAANLYHTFRTQGVKGPPVYDTKKAARQRNIEALRTKALELDRDWLTVEEAAQALGKPEKNVYAIRKSCSGEIPEIRNKVRGPRISPETAAARDLPRQEISSGEGLPVYAVRPGPKPGQVIYTLR